MRKIGELYFPSKEFQKRAWIKNKAIYQEAAKDPVKFWEKLARDLLWFKKWQKGFVHQPPYFQWFVGGKINITENIFRNEKNKTALIWEPESINEQPRILTYQELFQEVCQCANFLKKLGVKKGDRVGIYLPMIPEIAITMLACARIGAVHSVVFSAFSLAALKIRLQDTGAKVLITADQYYRRGERVDLLKSAREGIKETKVEDMVVIKRLGAKAPWHREKGFCPAEEMDSEDLFFILYTSGSTGQPKGVMHTCAGYMVQAHFTGKFIFDFHAKDIFWCTSDAGWITGHTYTFYAPLLNGISTVIFEGAPDFPTPDRWAQIIEKHHVTIFYTAPTAIRMFEKYGVHFTEKYQFQSLRLLGSVGEPIDEAAWLWYFKNVGKSRCPVVDTWWQTETGGILISSLPGLGPFKPAFTGLPFPGTKFDIKEGNLILRPPFAPGLLRGIYKNPEKYLETYWSQYGKSVYLTSDGALKDKNGLIRIIGRVDDVIKVAGHRISTGELEAVINLHPDIVECAVIGIFDKIKGEAPVAFVVSKTKKTNQAIKEEVVEQVKQAIGSIALPKEVYLVEDLPKTRSGKIMRRILRKLFTKEALGDLSTLANPQSVNEIKKIIK